MKHGSVLPMTPGSTKFFVSFPMRLSQYAINKSNYPWQLKNQSHFDYLSSINISLQKIALHFHIKNYIRNNTRHFVFWDFLKQISYTDLHFLYILAHDKLKFRWIITRFSKYYLTIPVRDAQVAQFNSNNFPIKNTRSITPCNRLLRHGISTKQSCYSLRTSISTCVGHRTLQLILLSFKQNHKANNFSLEHTKCKFY